MNYIQIFILSVFCITINAQIVTLDPIFATENDVITVTYDATQGSRGLIGEAQVYMHAGVVTTKSTSNTQWRHVIGNWGTDDARVKMVNIGGNKHTLQYNIRQFHNVPADEKVLRLAFVFRNINGSKEGKTSQFQDIFIDLYNSDGSLQVLLLSPTNSNFISEPGSIIPVKIASSIDAEFTLFDNDTLLTTLTCKSLNYNLVTASTGTHVISGSVIANNDTISGSFTYVVKPEVEIAGLPPASKLGLNRLSDTDVRLVLQAPEKDYVYVSGDFSDWKIDNDFFMKKSDDGQYWWLDITGLDPDRNYTYQYFVDGSIRVADPMSELVLDGNRDHEIGSNIFPNLPPFPTGKTSGIVTIFKPKKDTFHWQYSDYQRPDQSNLFIYELLMRDFLTIHSYPTLMDTLDYLERLGVTAIELMPINEFENNDSWGYNPSFHMALDKYYGTPEAFKRLVDECHRRGIAVLVDVVFNHAFGQSPLARLYWDTNRPAANNPWLNQEAKHPYNVGNDVNHESQATKDWMDQILRYWIEEYQIDGYRFDLTKGFTQRQSTEATASNYDASRVAILKRMADRIREYDENSILILEHFSDNTEEKELSEYGFMLWGNLNHSYSEASMGYHSGSNSNFNWISHKQRGWNHPHVVGFMESHDEERMMYRNLQFGNSAGGYSVKNLTTALERIELSIPFFLTIPGPKMIWQFGELGYDFSINRCTNGTINNNCRLSRKPIRWDYFQDERRKKIYNVFSLVGNLKKEYEIFKTTDFTLNVQNAFKTIQLRSNAHNINIIGNFGVTQLNGNPSFPKTGLWYEYFTGDSIFVSNVTMPVLLAAGEYRLYSDIKLENPGISTHTADFDIEESFISVSPNPASEILTVHINSASPAEFVFELVDLQGKVMYRINHLKIDPGISEVDIDIHHIQTGLYIIRLAGQKSVFSQKVMVVK